MQVIFILIFLLNYVNFLLKKALFINKSLAISDPRIFTLNYRLMSENIAKYNVILELITKQTGDIDKIKNNSNSIQNSFDKAKKAFIGFTSVGAALKVGQALSAISGKAIQLAADYETVTKSFKILLGSKAEADKLVADLEKFALETPFESKDILNATKTLLGFGRSAKEVRDDLKLIGNAAAATGASLSSLSLVFGQVAGVGRLMGQDAMQFINAGIPIYQVLGDYLKKDVGEIKKLQEEGKITFDTLSAAFQDASKEGGKFYGALEEQANSFAGLTAAANEYIEKVIRSFGDIILPFVKSFYQSFNTLMEDISTRAAKMAEALKPTIDAFITGLKPALDVLLQVISGVIGSLLTLVEAIISLPKFIIDNKKAIGLLVLALISLNGHLIVHEINTLRSKAATKLKAIAEDAAAKKTLLLEKAQKALNLAMRLNPIGLVVSAVLALAAGLVILYNRSETVRKVFSGLANIGRQLYERFKNIGAEIQSIFSGSFTDVLKKLGDLFFGSIIDSFKNIANSIVNIFKGDDIRENLKNIGISLVDILTLGWAKRFKDIGSKLAEWFNAGFNSYQSGSAKSENPLIADLRSQNIALERIIKSLKARGKEVIDLQIKLANNELRLLELKGASKEEINAKALERDKLIAAKEKKLSDARVKALQDENAILAREIKKREALGKSTYDLRIKYAQNELAILKEQSDEANKLLDKQLDIEILRIQKEKAAKEKAFKDNEERIKKNFVLREKEIRADIKYAKKLDEELKKLAIEEKLALLFNQQLEHKEGSTAFVEIANQIDELQRKYDELLNRPKLDVALLPPTSKIGKTIQFIDNLEKNLKTLNKALENAVDPRVKDALKKDIEEIERLLFDFTALPSQKKFAFEQGGFEAISLEQLAPKDRIPALKSRLSNVVNQIVNFRNKIDSGTVDALDIGLLEGFEGEAGKIIELLNKLGIDVNDIIKKIKPKESTILGLTQEDIQLATEAIDVARNAFSTVTDIYVAELDKRLAAQQDRVNKANDIAEKGNVDQLKLEQARLDELEAKRRKAIERQAILEKAAAQAQIAVNTLMTISNIQAGASKVFSTSGPAAPVVLPIVLAIVGGLIASAANIFKPPAFFKGTEEVAADPQFSKYKQHNGRDGYWAKFDGSERIVDGKTNRLLKGIPNTLLPRAVEALEIMQYPSVRLPMVSDGGRKMDLNELKDEMRALRQSVESMKIETKVDMDGFTQRIVRQYEKVNRRKTIRG